MHYSYIDRKHKNENVIESGMDGEMTFLLYERD